MRRNRHPTCPTCGRPLPTIPNPSGNPDVLAEILRRLTVLEQQALVADSPGAE